MPRGKREQFTIRLKADRAQRRALDEFLRRAHDVVVWAFDHQKQALQAGVPMRPEELAALATESHGLHRETVEHACSIAIERVRAVLGGEISERKGRTASLFAIPGSSVVFSVFERVVSVPHVGTCSFKGNMFALKTVEETGAKQLAMTAYRTELGYYNSEAVIIVDTVDRSPKKPDFSEQKLVKVVRRKPAAASES